MKKLLIATGNERKVDFFKQLLADFDVQLITPLDLDVHIDVEEGASIKDNALAKARAYFKETGLPTLAMDSGLFFTEYPLDAPIQPGAYIRRVAGRELTDTEMVDHYTNIAKQHNGKIEAYYLDVNVIIDGQGHEHVLFIDENIEASTFYMVETQFHRVSEGWPLDSITIDKATGMYLEELNDCPLNAEDAQQSTGKARGMYRKFPTFVEKALDI